MADRETARTTQNVNAQRVAVRSTVWLDRWGDFTLRAVPEFSSRGTRNTSQDRAYVQRSLEEGCHLGR